jgi:hypothetical protein
VFQACVGYPPVEPVDKFATPKKWKSGFVMLFWSYQLLGRVDQLVAHSGAAQLLFIEPTRPGVWEPKRARGLGFADSFSTI